MSDYLERLAQLPKGPKPDLGALRPTNPMTSQLLDLITLMPDSQTQEIVDYIMQLRAARAAAR